jgi:cellulose synthase (UDP-forming)
VTTHAYRDPSRESQKLRGLGRRSPWHLDRRQKTNVDTPQKALVLATPPSDREKLSYLDRQLPYLTLIILIGNGSVVASQIALVIAFHFWLLAPYSALSAVYLIISLTSNFIGRGFNYQAHRRLVDTWRPYNYPRVDIYLPICGEPLDILRNTWTYVFELIHTYPGIATAYVLDDGDNQKARDLARYFGFAYTVRPDRGWYKKSGNLRYAFTHTTGDFFVILDADFAPRPDFLAETLPYFDDPSLGILQTPQYFRTDRRQTWVERAAGAVQEIFYRSMQVTRDSLGASICVGTCAIYRRTCLEQEGGTTLIAYAEDVHTGLDARRNGWTLRYIPVALSTGMCPDNVDTFVRQQYRWCTGSTSTLLTSRLWTVPMSKRARLSYISGFLYYFYTGVALFVGPVVPIVLLATMPQHIQPRDYLLLAPALINGMVLYPVWHRCDYGPSTWPLAIIRGWAHVLAFWDFCRGSIMQWQTSGAKVSPVRRLWIGFTVWNGGTAVTWLGLAAWRISQSGPWRFWVITLFGLIYAGTIIKIYVPTGKEQQ